MTAYYPEMNQTLPSKIQIVLSHVGLNRWQVFYPVSCEQQVTELLSAAKIAQREKTEYSKEDYRCTANFERFFVAKITAKAAEKLQNMENVAMEILLD